jgi:hypothetical protein
MSSLTHYPLGSIGLCVLVGGLLAGALTGCGARRRLQAAETATAGVAGQPTTASANPGNGSASATPANSIADQIDAELQKMDSELSSADTLNDFSTALPPDAVALPATSTPSTGEPASTPVPNQPTAAPRPTTVPTGADQGVQLDQSLGILLDQLSKTDTVPEGANP